MGFFGKATHLPQTWDCFANDAVYQEDDEDIEEDLEDDAQYDASGGDLEGEDTSSDYDMPRSPYTRNLR
jgi:hypothetical protein